MKDKDIEFQLELTNENKIKERDLFVNFIYNLLPEKDSAIDYSVYDVSQPDGGTIFYLKYKNGEDVFRSGFMFGSYIENKKNKSRKIKKEGKNESKRIDPYIEHLRCQGYTIKSNSELLLLKHPEKNSFWMGEYSAGIFFQSNFRITQYAKKNPTDYLGFINTLNVNADVAKFIDNGGHMSATFCFPNIYDKKSFTHFLDLWEHDISDTIYQIEIYDKILVTQ